MRRCVWHGFDSKQSSGSVQTSVTLPVPTRLFQRAAAAMKKLAMSCGSGIGGDGAELDDADSQVMASGTALALASLVVAEGCAHG